MTCAEATPLVELELDGELDARSVLELREYVSRCPSCTRHAASLRALSDAAREHLRRFEPPAGFEDRLLRSVRPRRISRAWTGTAIAAAAAAADGSVARAMTLLDEDALTIREQALEVLARLPAVDPADLHALGDALAGTDPQPLAAFLDTVNAWLSQRLERGRGDLARLDRLAEASEHINAAARDAETYNLERKPLIFNVFGLLAEATRG